jgi:hypothetical protein
MATEPKKGGKRSAKKPKETVSKKTDSLIAEKLVKESKKVISQKAASTEPPTLEQIQLRAYFVSERRQRLGSPGDSTSDWIQAERELRDEMRHELG